MALSKPSFIETATYSSDCDDVENGDNDGDKADMMNVNLCPPVLNQLLSTLTPMGSEQALIRNQLGSMVAESAETQRTQTTIKHRLEMMASELAEVQNAQTPNFERLPTLASSQTPKIWTIGLDR